MNNFTFSGFIGVILILVSGIIDMGMLESNIIILAMFFIGAILLTNNSPATALILLICLKSQFFGFIDTSEFIRLKGILNSGDIFFLSLILVSIFRMFMEEKIFEYKRYFSVFIFVILGLVLFQIIYSSFIMDHSTFDEALRSGRNHLSFALYFFLIPLFDFREIKVFIYEAAGVSFIIFIVFNLNNISPVDITPLKKGLDIFLVNIQLRRTYIIIQPLIDLLLAISFFSIFYRSFSEKWLKFPVFWFLISLFNIFIFLSRGWWFAGVMIIILSIIYLKKMKIELSGTVVKVVSVTTIALMIISGTVLATILSDRIENALSDLSGENPGTFAQRLVQIERGFEFINNQAPLFGVGYTTFTSKITQILAGKSFGIDDSPTEYIFWGTNDYGILSTLFSFGYLGALIFYGAFFWIVARAYQIAKDCQNFENKLLIIAFGITIIATFLNGITGGFIFDPAVPIFIATACSFIDILYSQSSEEEEEFVYEETDEEVEAEAVC